VRVANLAQTINVLQAVILTNEEKMLLTPTYHVMEMYNVHQDAKLLPLTVKSNDYIFGDDKLQAVSASASIDGNGLTHVSLVNIDAKKSQEVEISFFGSQYKNVTGRIITSAALQDHNTFENPDKVRPTVFKDAQLKDSILKMKLPPFSVVVLELK
jgi:alpha-N-arabinofuranosidase